MKFTIVLLSVFAACSAHHVFHPYHHAAAVAGPTSFYRAPALDSAYVESSRVGGNFAYRTVEGHAYQGVTPLAYAAYPGYPAYSYIQAPFAAPAAYYPYQPAFIEQQPFGLKPAAEIIPAPAAAAPEEPKQGRQNGEEDDTVAVESA